MNCLSEVKHRITRVTCRDRNLSCVSSSPSLALDATVNSTSPTGTQHWIELPAYWTESRRCPLSGHHPHPANTGHYGWACVRITHQSGLLMCMLHVGSILHNTSIQDLWGGHRKPLLEFPGGSRSYQIWGERDASWFWIIKLLLVVVQDPGDKE